MKKAVLFISAFLLCGSLVHAAGIGRRKVSSGGSSGASLTNINTWTAPQTFSSATFTGSVQVSSITISTDALTVGTSDFSGGTPGIYLTGKQFNAAGFDSPPFKFFTSGDSDNSSAVVMVSSSYTLEMKLDSTSPQTLSTTRFRITNTKGKEILSVTQAGVEIDNANAQGTDSNSFQIGTTSMVVSQDGRIVIGNANPSGVFAIRNNNSGITNQPLLIVDSETRKMEVTGTSTTLRGIVYISSPLVIQNLSTAAFTLNIDTFSVLITTSPNNYLVGFTTTGHISVSGDTVALTGCGSGPTSSGPDTAFTITPGGGSPGGCTATFGIPYFNPPTCVVTPRTGSLVNSFSYTVSNTAVTITETSLTSLIDVICFGKRE